MMHGKGIWKPGELEPPAARVTVGLWPTATIIKLDLLWKIEVSKSSWIKSYTVKGTFPLVLSV